MQHHTPRQRDYNACQRQFVKVSLLTPVCQPQFVNAVGRQQACAKEHNARQAQGEVEEYAFLLHNGTA